MSTELTNKLEPVARSPMLPMVISQNAAVPDADASPPFPISAGLSKKRLAVAFAIAGISDVISAFTTFMPPVEWVVDFVTAVLLFVVLGWRWLLLPGLIMEAIPGVAVIPFWVLVVGAIAVWGTVQPKLN